MECLVANLSFTTYVLKPNDVVSCGLFVIHNSLGQYTYLGITLYTRCVYQGSIKAFYKLWHIRSYKIQSLPTSSLTFQFFCADNTNLLRTLKTQLSKSTTLTMDVLVAEIKICWPRQKGSVLDWHIINEWTCHSIKCLTVYLHWKVQ